MNPKRNRMSNFVLDLGLGQDLWRTLANTLICLCMHSYIKPFTNFDNAYDVHTSWLSNAAHTLCVCVCVRERERERERGGEIERETARERWLKRNLLSLSRALFWLDSGSKTHEVPPEVRLDLCPFAASLPNIPSNSCLSTPPVPYLIFHVLLLSCQLL
jgi:hypothetical protein